MRNLHLLNLLARNAKRGEFRADAATNTIYLYDFIVGSDEEAEWFGGVSPGAFARQLAGMTGDVALRINSPGGEVFAARAMGQAIREYPGTVTAHIDGLAASAATTVAVAAAKVVMAPDALFMIHNAWTLAYGNAGDFRATADLLDKIDAGIKDGYAAKGSKSADEFGAFMAAETWFSAQEAVDCGLCDEIAGAKDAPKDRVKAEASVWDLTAYEAAPKSPARNVSEIKLALDADGVRELIAEALAANSVREPTPDNTADDADETEQRRRVHAVRMLAETA